jgi:hypothetical protein
MIRILIMLVMFGCTVLNIKSKFKKVYKTPKLSSLKGKKFSNYIDNITKDL